MIKWTGWLLISIAVVLIGWDIAAAVLGGSQATISLVIRGWAQDYIIVPFAAGVLSGHWFWPLRSRR